MALLRCLLVALLVVACGSVAPSAAITGPIATEPTPSEGIDPAMAEWIRFRTAVGLRADEAWVKEVAANPASKAGSDAYEIPLLPDEVRSLQGRMGRIEDAKAFAASYVAQFPEGFAGSAIDDGERLVILYTKDVEIHQARLAVMAGAVRPEVRRATWTLEELTSFQSMVETAAPDPRIKVQYVTLDVLANRVLVTYSANTRKLGETLISKFGSTGWLVPRWFGRLDPWDGPVGGLRIKVVDAGGVPQFDLQCRSVSLHPDIREEEGGNTNRAGVCDVGQVPIGPYRITILDRDEVVDRILKVVQVEVTAGETLIVRVVIPDPS